LNSKPRSNKFELSNRVFLTILKALPGTGTGQSAAARVLVDVGADARAHGLALLLDAGQAAIDTIGVPRALAVVGPANTLQ